jgi:cytochrome c553
LLRRGIHPNRRDLWIMPSQMFQRLSPTDMAALIAHLRKVPPSGDTSPPPMLGPKALAEIAAGRYKPAAQMVRDFRNVLPVDAGRQFAQGRYIASATCVECHGMQLEGAVSEDGATPDLIVAAAYSLEQFDHFITTGEAPGNRKVHELMVSVARSRFSYLTQHERQALYAYLHARAELPQ